MSDSKRLTESEQGPVESRVDPRKRHSFRAVPPTPRPTTPAQVGAPLVVKRLIDIAGASLLLLITAPIQAVSMAAIVIESGRPALYPSIRIGKNKRSFRVWKLRTMHVDADDELHKTFLADALSQHSPAADDDGGELQKLVDDPRVTSVGGVLRRWSFDELPQLVNVLRGEMSLVGPRPEVPYALEHYRSWHYRRFDVLPGLTGLWQVNGRSQRTAVEMLRLDVEYAARWTIWLDIRILLKTLPSMVGKGGAAV